MSTTTYIVRDTTGQVTDSRNSGTMHYTHAVVRPSDGRAYSWHTSEALARTSRWHKDGNKVVAVEAHKGGKAAVLKRLAKADEAAEVAHNEAHAATTDAAGLPLDEAPVGQVKATKPVTPKAAPVNAGARSVPTEAANEARQAYVAKVGITTYRNQYNGGWDAATAGQGEKKAASGTATVAWMDGWTDRTANPGKAGIASKWAALRSTTAPVAKVDAPATEAAPKITAAPSPELLAALNEEKAEKAAKAPAKPRSKSRAAQAASKA